MFSKLAKEFYSLFLESIPEIDEISIGLDGKVYAHDKGDPHRYQIDLTDLVSPATLALNKEFRNRFSKMREEESRLQDDLRNIKASIIFLGGLYSPVDQKIIDLLKEKHKLTSKILDVKQKAWKEEKEEYESRGASL
ncbi:MAG: hypothetical protein KDH96_07270 [Candidatus Riesia sp.]|nr:hypothetical protein [Candidatus Riesia sp.]